MRTLLKTILFSIVFILGLSFNPTVVHEAELRPEDYTVKQALAKFTKEFGSDYQLVLSVVSCESHFNPKTIGDKGLALNIGQFHRDTFLSMSKEFGEQLDYNSYYDQAKLISWAFSQGESYKRQWTTYVAIKNGGEYSFYSKQLKDWYTIKCKLISMNA